MRSLQIILSYLVSLSIALSGGVAHSQENQAQNGVNVELVSTKKNKNTPKNAQAYVTTSDGKKIYTGVYEITDSKGNKKQVGLSFNRSNNSTESSKMFEQLKMMQYRQQIEKTLAQNKTATQSVKESTLKFPIDTATFFIAIGSIIATEMIFNYAGNPLAMQRHFESLTDPIAHLSFYAFIVANGLTTTAFLKSGHAKLDQLAMQRLMRRLPYMGMTAGSITSNLVSDIAHTLKSCAKEIGGFKKPENKFRSSELYTECDEALRLWTFEKKFNEKAPVLISLFSSQVLSDWTMRAIQGSTTFVGNSAAAKSAVQLAKSANGFVASHIAFDIADSQLLTAAKWGGRKAVGAAGTTASITGKIALTGMRLVGNPVIFMGLDMALTSPASIRIWNTVSSDSALTQLKKDLPRNVKQCQKQIEREPQPSALTKWALVVLGESQSTDTPCDHLFNQLIRLRDYNQTWRGVVNSDFETGLMDWTETIDKMSLQIQFAQDFYSNITKNSFQKKFSELMCSSEAIPNYCESNKSLNPLENPVCAAALDSKIDRNKLCAFAKSNDNSNTLVRPYPLFGVFADPKLLDSKKDMSPAEVKTRTNDAYIDFPDQIDIAQVIHIANVLQEFDEFVLRSRTYKMTESVQKVLVSILTKLQSAKIEDGKLSFDQQIKIGQGLAELNALLADHKGLYTSDRSQWNELNALRARLGNPNPILREGVAYPYIYSSNSNTVDAAPISTFRMANHRYPYQFPTSAHYMIHEMICGPEKATMDSMIGWGVFRTFIPPKLIKTNDQLAQFCNPQLLPEQQNYAQYFMKNFEVSGVSYSSPLVYLLDHVSPEAIYPHATKKEIQSSFEQWWIEKSEPIIQNFYQESQIAWLKIYTDLIASFKDEGYVQDYSKRNGIAKIFKGAFSDLSTQTKNPLALIENEADVYLKILGNLNLNEKKSKDTSNSNIIRKADQLGEFSAAMQDAIEYLLSIHTVISSGSENVIMKNYYPDSKTVNLIDTRLNEAVEQIATTYAANEFDQSLRHVNMAAVYGLRNIKQELAKYLRAGFVVERPMDLESIKNQKQMMEKMVQAMAKSSAPGKTK